MNSQGCGKHNFRYIHYNYHDHKQQLQVNSSYSAVPLESKCQNTLETCLFSFFFFGSMSSVKHSSSNQLVQLPCNVLSLQLLEGLCCALQCKKWGILRVNCPSKGTIPQIAGHPVIQEFGLPLSKAKKDMEMCYMKYCTQNYNANLN